MAEDTLLWFVRYESGYYSFYEGAEPIRNDDGAWPRDRGRTAMGPHCFARLGLPAMKSTDPALCVTIVVRLETN